MNYSLATLELMHRAVMLGSCWCTNRMWYAPKLDPIRCTNCLAREAIIKDNPQAVDSTVASKQEPT